MNVSDLNLLKTTVGEVLQSHLSGDAWTWLTSEASALEKGADIKRFNTAFVMMPRKTGKSVLMPTPEQAQAIERSRPGFRVDGWSADRLSRVWLIMHLRLAAEEYVNVLENLFINAEMNELVALYSSLPVLEYPERWRMRCAEGIRSNIAQVLESIMCNNPYPAEQLDEAAWNQLVLKAIFTEKPLLEIYRLRERANAALAESISLFAHERWAAGRSVNPLVWICVVKFVNERLMQDIERLAYSIESAERKAAALVCSETTFPAATALLAANKELESLARENSWASVSPVNVPAT